MTVVQRLAEQLANPEVGWRTAEVARCQWASTAITLGWSPEGSASSAGGGPTKVDDAKGASATEHAPAAIEDAAAEHAAAELQLSDRQKKRRRQQAAKVL